MAGNKNSPRARLFWRAGVLLVAGLLLWAFPPFHVVKSSQSHGVKADNNAGAPFDAAAAATRIWTKDFPAAADKAGDLLQLARAVQSNPTLARTQHGRQSGLGATYYFARGKGRVLSREGSRVRVALDDANTLVIELRLGPVFGNTVRDGSGLLNVNSFPGLQEFNALSGELNTLVETQILPALREKALPGTSISFTGCAEAPESLPAAGAPLLVFIPIKAEIL